MTAIENLPARMAEVIGSHEWTDFPRSAHNQHNYYAECAVCQRDVLRMAEVALGVRDGLVAHLSARAAAAEARVGHAEAGAQLSSERLAEVRQELAEAKDDVQAWIRSANAWQARAERAEQELAVVKRNWHALSERLANAHKEIAGRKEHGEELRAKLNATKAAFDRAWEMHGEICSETELAEARAATERVSKWVTSDVVTTKSSFGDGYREAMRDVRDLMTAPVEGTATPARETA